MALLIFLVVLVAAEFYWLQKHPLGPAIYVTTDWVPIWSSAESRSASEGYIVPGMEFRILKSKGTRVFVVTVKGGTTWIEKGKGYRRK